MKASLSLVWSRWTTLLTHQQRVTHTGVITLSLVRTHPQLVSSSESSHSLTLFSARGRFMELARHTTWARCILVALQLLTALSKPSRSLSHRKIEPLYSWVKPSVRVNRDPNSDNERFKSSVQSGESWSVNEGKIQGEMQESWRPAGRSADV